MKQLKKHPKQQRMEDMTFPLQKFDPNPKSLGFSVAVKKLLDEGTKPKGKLISPPYRYGDLFYKKAYCNRPDRHDKALLKADPYLKEQVTMTGREWLRSINDDLGFRLMPRIVWRVVAVGVLVGAVIYFFTQLWRK